MMTSTSYRIKLKQWRKGKLQVIEKGTTFWFGNELNLASHWPSYRVMTLKKVNQKVKGRVGEKKASELNEPVLPQS